MPANNVRAHEKAMGVAADALIFDLEDAVAEPYKAEARHLLSNSLSAYRYQHQQLFLRINHPDSVHAQKDIALLAQHPQFAGVVVPKVESAATVQRVCQWMESAGCSQRQSILAMLETPAGILNAPAIAQASNRLSGLMAGTNDLSAALHLPVSTNRSGLSYALLQIVLAARANELMVFDGVYNNLSDIQGFIQECMQGREWGFDGKSLIHPSHIEAANAAFSPSTQEVEKARKIVADWQAQHSGVTTTDGAMIEELHVRNAQRILATHQNIKRNSME